MSTLILNAGSSSLRFSLFTEAGKESYKGHIDAIGLAHCHFRRSTKDGEERRNLKAKNHKEALDFALQQLLRDAAIASLSEIQKVGHRVVHGGEKFKKPLKITSLNLKKLEKLNALAPLHNPANLAGIKASRKFLAKAKQYAIFDTAFHSTLPPKAFLYGLPYSLYKKDGIRRYGFHGSSHKYVAAQAAKKIKKKNAKLITCHIGNGVSLAAVKNGVCLDTSMGFTPLEGPMMGSRSGSIDPAIVFHLMKKHRSSERVHEILEKESGFKGLSGISSDIRKLWARAHSAGSQRTFETFSYQMAKLILSYFAPLGAAPDAIVFTAGIGENAFYLRKEICNYLKAFGLKLDPSLNKLNKPLISSKDSSIKVLVIPTREEFEMFQQINSL